MISFKKFCLLFCLGIISLPSIAQFSLNKGTNAVDIGGLLLLDYNYRFDTSSNANRSKNIFRLEDARIEFKGKLKEIVKYHIQCNLVDIGATAMDFTAKPIMDANIEIGSNKYTVFKLGYGKVPYSFISLRDAHTPFLQKPEFLRNQIMPRRALGLTFTKTFWLRRINFITGIYNSSGEQTLSGINDENGLPESVSRLEIGFPAQYDGYLEVDKSGTPVPLFFLGLNSRYANTTVATTDQYHLYTIAGKKLMYGGDINFLYRGFALLFETDIVKAMPDNVTALNPFDSATYFKAGAFVGEISYCAKPLHSLLAIRYDEFNPTDLIADNTTRSLEFAYTYAIPQTGVDLKVFYAHFLPYAVSNISWKKDEVRIGLEYFF